MGFYFTSSPSVVRYNSNKVNTPTVTSQIPHFWSHMVFEQNVWIFWVRKMELRMDFLCNIKEFLDEILLIFHVQETCKSITHNPGPHPMSLTMTSAPSHDGPIFIAMGDISIDKIQGNASDNLLSWCYHFQCTAD
jgi:hypothetical protein